MILVNDLFGCRQFVVYVVNHTEKQSAIQFSHEGKCFFFGCDASKFFKKLFKVKSYFFPSFRKV